MSVVAARKTAYTALLCAARFGRSAPCVFCGLEDGDRMQHVLRCLVAAAADWDAVPGCPAEWG
eukprot:15462022-Alexandrium_andersonii.AAC.1